MVIGIRGLGRKIGVTLRLCSGWAAKRRSHKSRLVPGKRPNRPCGYWDELVRFADLPGVDQFGCLFGHRSIAIDARLQSDL